MIHATTNLIIFFIWNRISCFIDIFHIVFAPIDIFFTTRMINNFLKNFKKKLFFFEKKSAANCSPSVRTFRNDRLSNVDCDQKKVFQKISKFARDMGLENFQLVWKIILHTNYFSIFGRTDFCRWGAEKRGGAGIGRVMKRRIITKKIS